MNSSVRTILRESVEKAAGVKDPYRQHLSFKELLFELSRADKMSKNYRTGQVPYTIKLVKVFLSLPDDCFPVGVTDEEVNHLVVWGDLPEDVVLLLKPRPKIFITPELPLFYLDDVKDAKKVKLSEERYDKLRRNYQKRMRIGLAEMFKGVSMETIHNELGLNNLNPSEDETWKLGKG